MPTTTPKGKLASVANAGKKIKLKPNASVKAAATITKGKGKKQNFPKLQ